MGIDESVGSGALWSKCCNFFSYIRLRSLNLELDGD